MYSEKIKFFQNFNPVTNFNPGWIAIKIDAECVKYMEDFGFFLCDLLFEDRKSGKIKISNRTGNNALTTSQIRNFYGEVKRIEMQIPRNYKEENMQAIWDNVSTDFLLLKPKLAYNTARVLKNKRDSKITKFKEVIFLASNEVKSVKQYKNFSQFLEGVLAFHKSFGGRD